MTGILLIGVLALWAVMANWLVRQVGGVLPKAHWRKVGQVGLFAALLPLPLIDEIVGGWQFAQLCKQHDAIQLDWERIKGATVYFVPTKSVELKDMWVPVRHQAWPHIDKNSGAVVMQYDSFHATGGWLIRALRISEGNVPLLFPGTCFPKENPVELMKSLNVTTLDRPTRNSGEK
jgi:hypothetical protein